MSDKEMKRRKTASLIFIQAWRLRRRSKANMSCVLLISWRSYKGLIRLQHSKAVGVTFEGRQAILNKLYNMPDHYISLSLKREPNNPYDSNAIKIIAKAEGIEHHIGYMPKETSAYVAPMLDADYKSVAFFDNIYKGTRQNSYYGLFFRYALLDPTLIKKKAA